MIYSGLGIKATALHRKYNRIKIMEVLLVVIFLVTITKATHSDSYDLQDTNSETRKEFQNRIRGGYVASPHAFPYQAFLHITLNNGTNRYGGGSLITPRAVLTAAHCLYDARIVEVTLGAHNIEEAEPTQLKLNSTHFIIYPYWYRVMHDLAIIKLPRSVTLNANIQVVKIPNKYYSFINQVATVSGWGGVTDPQEEKSPVLQYTANRIISNALCRRIYHSEIPKMMLCVSSEGGKTICQGDSGGPLTIRVRGNFQQIGVACFVHKNGCQTGYPPVYTRLSSYINWIQTNAGVTITYGGIDQQLLLILIFLIFLF